jgi:serine/threonine protein kinase
MADTLHNIAPFRPPARGEMIPAANGVYFMGDYIGGGAFGDVFECTDEWSNPLVAKVLRPARTFDEMYQHWQAEVANLQMLRHPNITYIHDAFVFENLFYIVVEKCLYSLDRVLPKIDETWVPHIARDILQALSFIHRFGYVHKDVHPGNVFVSLTSDAISHDQGPFVSFKLGDLGITKLEHEIRVTGTILAPWMKPPEAIEPGEYGVVGRQTDVYHTALLLLSVLNKEVLTFTEQDIVLGAPMRLAEALQSPFRQAIACALHPHVLRRTQSALEFWREMQAALQYVG